MIAEGGGRAPYRWLRARMFTEGAANAYSSADMWGACRHRSTMAASTYSACKAPMLKDGCLQRVGGMGESLEPTR